MSERFPTAAQRRGWQHRGASSPEKPVVLDGRSARGLLALLEAHGHFEAHGALDAALATGCVDAIRAAMDAARDLVPAGATIASPVETPDEAA